MAIREELVIRTMSEGAYLALQDGGRLLNEDGGLFLLADQSFVSGVKLTEYKYVKNRMGMPSLTATLKVPRCLDNEWTGREYVIFRGEHYFLREVSPSKKDNTDERYEHELTFTCERTILGQVYFFDVVCVDNAMDYKPTTNSTRVQFYGTLREFVGRLNCALAYAKVGDSGIYTTSAEDFVAGRVDIDDDGYSACVASDTTYDVDTAKELSVESQYIFNVLEEAYKVWEVPFEFRGRQIVFGAPDRVVDIPLAYGYNRELLTVAKNRKDSLIINEITAKGSTENIPYYYPNDTEFGHIQLQGSTYNNTLQDIGDFRLVKPALLTSKTREGAVITFRYVGEPDAYGIGPVKLMDSDHNNEWIDCNEREWVLFEEEPDHKEYGTRECPVRLVLDIAKAGDYCLQVVASWRLEDDAEELAVSHDMVPEGLIDQVVVYPNNDAATGAHITPTKVNGNTAFKITFDNAGQYRIDCNAHLPEKSIYIKFTSIMGLNIAEDHKYWEDSTGKRYYNLKYLGIETDLEFGSRSNGDKFSWTGEDRMPFQTNLMVPKYRETQGAEMFYKALNGQDSDAYRDANGHIYHFPHPCTAGWISQYEHTVEEIKPTIEGIRNDEIDPETGLGKLFGEIAEVAFDDNDNDFTKIGQGDEESATAEYEHSFFYIRLNRLRYVDGDNDYSLNLFEMASQEGEMTLQMTSGRCAGCKFKIQVLDGTGENAGRYLNPVQVNPNGDIVGGDYESKVRKSRIIESQQDTSAQSVWICVQKDIETFGVIMPNRTNNFLPAAGDQFNIVNIRLPKCYIIDAERRLEMAMMEYMARNNEERWTFDIGMSQVYIAEHPEIEDVIDENSVVQIEYGDRIWRQYVSSIEYEWKNDSLAPSVKLTLDDEIAAKSNFVQKTVYNAIKMTKDEATNLTRKAWLTPLSESTTRTPVTTVPTPTPTTSTSGVIIACGRRVTYTLPELSEGVTQSMDACVCLDSTAFSATLTLVPSGSAVVVGQNITNVGDVTSANVDLGVGSYRILGWKHGSSTVWNVLGYGGVASGDSNPGEDVPIVTPLCPAPIITISEDGLVTISFVDGATVYYTTDGTDPTTSSTPYTDPFEVEGVGVVKAMAMKPGHLNSQTVSEPYDVTPYTDPFEVEYELLSYIESVNVSNKYPYINTGLLTKKSGYRLQSRAMLYVCDPGTAISLFGKYYGAVGGQHQRYYVSTITRNAYNIGFIAGFTNLTNNFNNATVYDIDIEYRAGKQEVKLNGTTLHDYAWSGDGCVETNVIPACGAGKYYSLKVWDAETDNLLLDFVPVLRKSDNAVGMYDRVSNSFFGNANAAASAFVAGTLS